MNLRLLCCCSYFAVLSVLCLQTSRAADVNKTSPGLVSSYLSSTPQSSTSSLLTQAMDFFDRYRFDVNLSFLRDLTSLLSRSPTSGLSTSSLLSFNLVSLALLFVSAFISYFVYPMISGSWVQRFTAFDLGTSVEEIGKRVSRALDDFSHIDSDTCMKMAMCTHGKKKEHRAFGRSQASVAFSIVDHILKTVKADSWTNMRDRYKLAQEFGAAGGECDTFNRLKKCPIDSQTWNLLLSSLSKFL